MNKILNSHKSIKKSVKKNTNKNIKQKSTSYISTDYNENTFSCKISSQYPRRNCNTVENDPISDPQISNVKLPTQIINLKGNNLNFIKNPLKANQSLNSLNPKKDFNCCNIINNYYMAEVKKNECLTFRQNSVKNKYAFEKKIIKEIKKQYDQTSNSVIQMSFKANKGSLNKKIQNIKLSNYHNRNTNDLINKVLTSKYIFKAYNSKNMKTISNKQIIQRNMNRKKYNKIQNNKSNFNSFNQYSTKENIFNNAESLIPNISLKDIPDLRTTNNKIFLDNNEENNISYKKLIPKTHKAFKNYGISIYPLAKANSSNYLQPEKPYKNLKSFSNIISKIPNNSNIYTRKSQSPDTQNFNLNQSTNNNYKLKRNRNIFDNIHLLLDDNLYTVSKNQKNNKTISRQSFSNYCNYSTNLVPTGNLLINLQKPTHDKNIISEKRIENNNKSNITFTKKLSPILKRKQKKYDNQRNTEKVSKILISDEKNSTMNNYNNSKFNTDNNEDNIKYPFNKFGISNINNITNCIKELATLCVNQEKIINDLSENNRKLSKKLYLQNLKK